VANQPRLPKILLVETNVLSRATDEVLVGRYSSKGNAEPLFFRPVRSAVAAYENWRHAPVTQAQAASAHARLLQQPPSDFDNRIYVDRAVQEANTEDPTVVTRINVQKLQQLIAALEQRGARVLLFQLPLAQELENAGFARTTGDIVHGRFPDSGRWLPIDVARSELRWADGVHLDERSALIVVQSIDRAISLLR
jgi:hypothetical protein